jgi:Arc/MetJ family transcription regulator
MQMTLDIDDRLLRRAMRVTGTRTKNEVIKAALQMLVKTYGQTSIRILRDKVRLAGDLEMTNKRNLFDELMEGAASMKTQREAKVAVRKRRVSPQESEKIRAQAGIRQLRGKVRWDGDLEGSRASRSK